MPLTKPGPASVAPAFMALLAGVLLVLGAGLVWAWSSAAQAAALAAQALRAQQSLTALAALQAAVNNAETAPVAALAAVGAVQAELRTLLAGNPEQYTRLVALGPLIARRFDAALAAGQPQRRGAAGSNNVDRGVDNQRLQQQTGAAFAELRRAAQAEFETARQRGDGAARSARAAAVAPGALALLLLGAAGWQIHQQRSRVESAAATAGSAQAARALAESALLQVMDVVPDALCVLDSDGRFVRANAGCHQLWGRPADQLIGSACIDLVLAEDQRKTEQAIESVLAIESVQSWHNRCKRHDGAVIPVAWRGVWSAQQQLLVCLASDTSEIESLRADAAGARQALATSGAQLAQAEGRAAAAGRLNARFINTLGARMRPQPPAIVSAVDILLQGLAGPLTREQQRNLAAIRDHAQKLQGLVSAGIDMASLEAGQLQLSLGAFDVWETANEVATAVRPLAQDKALKFDLSLADNLGYARGDAARVAQVLRELLHNAVRFTEHGSVKLQADTPQPGQVRFVVTDTGIGIAPEDQAGLFEPFHHVDSEAARRHTGSGLGLAVSRRLARLMGGDVVLAGSQLQRGSTFSFTLQADEPTKDGPT